MPYAYRMAVKASKLKIHLKALSRDLRFKFSFLIVYNDKETFLFVSRELFPTGVKGYFSEISTPIRTSTVERIRAYFSDYKTFGDKSLIP